MPTSVPMPRLGESVSEGTVTRWLKSEGDRVEVDEPLVEVSTDKVDTEIPSPVAGVLERIVVGEDQTVEVGAELAVIGDGADDAAAPAAQPAEPATQVGQSAQGEQSPPSGQGAQAAPAPSVSKRQSEPEERPMPPQSSQAEPAGPAEPPAVSGDSVGGVSVTMPALGESVTEGVVTRWLKEVGDTIAVDEPLVEVSTDKVDTEIPSPVAGTLASITAAQDATVQVGGELAVIAGAGSATAGTPAATSGATAPEPEAAASSDAPQEPAPPAQPHPPTRPPAPAPEQESAAVESAPAPVATRQSDPPAVEPESAATAVPAGESAPPNGQGAYVTPLVRKLAGEQGIDLSAVTGTGVGGRIRKQDILAAAEAKRAQEAAARTTPATPARPAGAPSPLRGRTEKMSRLRGVIARRMVESLQTSAQLTTVVEADVTKIARLRQQAKEDFQARHGVKLTFLPFFALAAVEALREHPRVNSTVEMASGTITYPDAEHLGIAVDTERGLLVPVIRDAGDLNLGGMARKIADLAERTRRNRVTPDELSGGTFTLTNTGSRGALFDTPIINQPQSAILGTGAVVKRAVVVDDPDLGELILPRSMVYLALSYDHRTVDGADAARFLVSVKDRLEGGLFDGDLGLS